jgi:hypothetical protein
MPMVAMSMYTPPGAARNRSTPMPFSTIELAAFFHSACSVWKSFFSESMPWSLLSSRRNSRPGPQVGSAASEQTILPPVTASASMAAVSVGSWARRVVMVDLDRQPARRAERATYRDS